MKTDKCYDTEECEKEVDIRKPFKLKAFPDLSMCGLDASLMKTTSGTFDYALAKTIIGNDAFVE